MMTDTDEQKLIDLSKKVASASYMSWQEVRRIVKSLIVKNSEFSLEKQLDELIKEVNSAPRPENKGWSRWWTDSPERRELVTRRGPRSLEKPIRTQRRRFRNIKRKGVKHVRSKNSQSSCEI